MSYRSALKAAHARIEQLEAELQREVEWRESATLEIKILRDRIRELKAGRPDPAPRQRALGRALMSFILGSWLVLVVLQTINCLGR